MASRGPADLTQLLRQAGAGDESALHIVAPLVYDVLHQQAQKQSLRQRPGDTLEPTDLVHEAYLRLFAGPAARRWESRRHFYGFAARTLRTIIIDRVRARRRLKRSAKGARVPFDQIVEQFEDHAGDLEALDAALDHLANFDREAARMIELQFFAGLKVADIARIEGLSHRSVERRLQLSRAFLRRKIEGGS